MRQRRRSIAGPFGTGLLCAALVTATFVGLHHVWAPPAPEPTATDASSIVQIVRRSVTASVEQLFGAPHQTPPSSDIQGGSLMPALTAAGAGLPVSFTPVAVDVDNAGGVSPSDGTASLTRTVQLELQRVGCYAGRAHGTWDQATRSAMLAFAQTAGLKLKVSGPDWVLLTVLQGQNGPACSASGVVAAAPAAISTTALRKPDAAVPAAATTLQYSAVPISTPPDAWMRDTRMTTGQSSSIETGTVQRQSAAYDNAPSPTAAVSLAKPVSTSGREPARKTTPVADVLRDVARASP